MTGDHFISRESEVAENKIFVRKLRVNQCLQPIVVLHPIGESISDDANVFVLFDFERGGALRCKESERQQDAGQ
jgi:hypothetical protein